RRRQWRRRAQGGARRRLVRPFHVLRRPLTAERYAMARRSGLYIVPTDYWYIERAVWLIAGFVLCASTAAAALIDPRFALFVTATGLASIAVAFTGYCIVGNVLHRLGLPHRLGTAGAVRGRSYFMQTDRWYLERRIYVTVGVNISIGS